jgi:hypothetical protein
MVDKYKSKFKSLKKSIKIDESIPGILNMNKSELYKEIEKLEGDINSIKKYKSRLDSELNNIVPFLTDKENLTEYILSNIPSTTNIVIRQNPTVIIQNQTQPTNQSILSFTLTCPKGLKFGDKINFSFNGKKYTTTIPEGISEGEEFNFDTPVINPTNKLFTVTCPDDKISGGIITKIINGIKYIISIPTNIKPGMKFNVSIPMDLTDDDYLKAGLSIISSNYLNDSLSGGANVRDLAPASVAAALGTAITAAAAPAAVTAAAPAAATAASAATTAASATAAGAAAVGTAVATGIAAYPVIATAAGTALGIHGIAKARNIYKKKKVDKVDKEDTDDIISKKVEMYIKENLKDKNIFKGNDLTKININTLLDNLIKTGEKEEVSKKESEIINLQREILKLIKSWYERHFQYFDNENDIRLFHNKYREVFKKDLKSIEIYKQKTISNDDIPDIYTSNFPIQDANMYKEKSREIKKRQKEYNENNQRLREYESKINRFNECYDEYGNIKRNSYGEASWRCSRGSELEDIKTQYGEIKSKYDDLKQSVDDKKIQKEIRETEFNNIKDIYSSRFKEINDKYKDIKSDKITVNKYSAIALSSNNNLKDLDDIIKNDKNDRLFKLINNDETINLIKIYRKIYNKIDYIKDENIDDLNNNDDLIEKILKTYLKKIIYEKFISNCNNELKEKEKLYISYVEYCLNKFGDSSTNSLRTKYDLFTKGIRKKIVDFGLSKILQIILYVTYREYQEKKETFKFPKKELLASIFVPIPGLFEIGLIGSIVYKGSNELYKGLFDKLDRVKDEDIKSLLKSLKTNEPLKKEILSTNISLKDKLEAFIKQLEDEEAKIKKDKEDKLKEKEEKKKKAEEEEKKRLEEKKKKKLEKKKLEEDKLRERMERRKTQKKSTSFSTGSSNTGTSNTGSSNTGSSNTGSSNTGSSNVRDTSESVDLSNEDREGIATTGEGISTTGEGTAKTGENTSEGQSKQTLMEQDPNSFSSISELKIIPGDSAESYSPDGPDISNTRESNVYRKLSDDKSSTINRLMDKISDLYSQIEENKRVKENSLMMHVDIIDKIKDEIRKSNLEKEEKDELIKQLMFRKTKSGGNKTKNNKSRTKRKKR